MRNEAAMYHRKGHRQNGERTWGEIALATIENGGEYCRIDIRRMGNIVNGKKIDCKQIRQTRERQDGVRRRRDTAENNGRNPRTSSDAFAAIDALSEPTAIRRTAYPFLGPNGAGAEGTPSAFSFLYVPEDAERKGGGK